MANNYIISPSWQNDVTEAAAGTLPTGDNSSMGSNTVPGMQRLLQRNANAGQTFQNGIVSTYSLVYTYFVGIYAGGVLAPNGDIHFVPLGANRGQKISASGVVSTYSLVYTNSNGAYVGEYYHLMVIFISYLILH